MFLGRLKIKRFHELEKKKKPEVSVSYCQMHTKQTEKKTTHKIYQLNYSNIFFSVHKNTAGTPRLTYHRPSDEIQESLSTEVQVKHPTRP